MTTKRPHSPRDSVEASSALANSHPMEDVDQSHATLDNPPQKKKKKKRSKGKATALGDLSHHYENIAEVPYELQKYWHQRHRLFSRYDYGIRLTDSAWFGVTPEPVALCIAQFMSEYAPPKKTILIDMFSGVGGNTIQFALSGRWEKVIGIDIDPDVVECAKANAAIYEVETPIEWIVGDSFEVFQILAEDIKRPCVVFASPPWGGPGYTVDEVFNVEKMEPYPLKQLQDSIKSLTDDYALFLPRTSDLRQIAGSMGPKEHSNAVQYCVSGASKGLCAYFGNLGRRGLDQTADPPT